MSLNYFEALFKFRSELWDVANPSGLITSRWGTPSLSRDELGHSHEVIQDKSLASNNRSAILMLHLGMEKVKSGQY
jgi:hypothetical protein